MKVLIVDDVVIERDKLERIVTAAGHSVLVAETADECVAQALRERPDVILMDVNMPDMDGFAATRRLKSDAQTRDIPVVFVTGENSKADIAWGRMLGARGFVTRPYSEEHVLNQLTA